MELTWSSPSKKIYLDANIFLNVWYKEMMQLGKIYDSSKKLLQSINDCHYFLVISNLVIYELSKKMEVSEQVIIDKYLQEFFLTKKIKIIKISSKIAQDASYMHSSQGIHMADAIHAIAALMNSCVLVTRDKELI